MKQEIIETLRSHLHDTMTCRKDFEDYDVPDLNTSDEPFLWAVSETGTTLLKVGTSAVNHLLSKESARMEIFRNNQVFADQFKYYNDHNVPCECFYWDGITLQPISLSSISGLLDNLLGATIKEAAERFPEEVAICNKPLEIKFANEGTEKLYWKSMEYAELLEDRSFLDCIKSLELWQRRAVNHYMVINAGCDVNSYHFTEMINKTVGVFGGILFDKHTYSKHWTLHT